MKWIITVLISAMALGLAGCQSSEKSKPKGLPSRTTDSSELPWAKPASWEGGLPGMGGIGTPNRY